MPRATFSIFNSANRSPTICLSKRALIFFVRWRLKISTVIGIEAPNSKLQAPEKHQAPSAKPGCYAEKFRYLEFEVSLELGCWSLELSFLSAMFLVGRDDALDERMPDHVALAELNDRNAFDVFQNTMSFQQAGMFVRRQINLRLVAGDDRFRAVAEAGEKHQHLLGRRVLRLVEDDESVVQRAPAHVGQRRDFNRAALRVFRDFLGGQHVMQRVLQWPKIRRDFFVKVARQKTERLAGLHGGAGEN